MISKQKLQAKSWVKSVTGQSTPKNMDSGIHNIRVELKEGHYFKCRPTTSNENFERWGEALDYCMKENIIFP